MVALSARITSLMPPDLTRSSRLAISRSEGLHAIDGRNDAAEHVVETAKLDGSFDCHDLFNIFDHADDGTITGFVGTDGTDLRIGDVVTHRAIVNFLFEAGQCASELLYRFVVLTEQVKHQTKCRLPADAR